jgi:hypothetical protein
MTLHIVSPPTSLYHTTQQINSSDYEKDHIEKKDVFLLKRKQVAMENFNGAISIAHDETTTQGYIEY